MTTTRQSRTWPYDLLKAIIALILLGLMLYLRPDVGAMIQSRLGLPFGTVTMLDTPQVAGANPTTLSGRAQSGATVDVFAGDAKLGTTTAGADGAWSLPVTLPAGTYQLRAQARDAAGADLGAPAVVEWNSEQQAAAPNDAQPPADSSQVTDTGTITGTADADAGTDIATEAATETATGTATAAGTTDTANAADTGDATAATESTSTAPSLETPKVNADGVTFAGSGQPGTIVEVVSSDGAIGTATVGQDGAWTLSAQLAPGQYELQARAVDASGAQGGASPVLMLTVSDTAAADAADAAAAAADTGTANTGTADGEASGASAATTDTASISPTQVPIAAVQITENGAEGGAAESATTGVSVAAPQMSEPILSGDRAMLSGTAAPGATVEIVSNDRFLGKAVADADGQWAVAAQLKPGFHALQVRTRDATGAQVLASPAVSLTVPAAAGPTVAAAAVVTATAPAELAAAGALTATTPSTTAITETAAGAATDTITNTGASADAEGAAAPAVSTPAVTTPPTLSRPTVSGSTLTLSGTGAPGSTVEIVSGTTVLGKATVGADGQWSLSSKVKPGDYKLQVVRKDAAGKVISQSPVVALNIPAPAAALRLDEPQIAAGSPITLTGAGEPGSVIEIVQDGAVAATADVQDDGTWSYSLPAGQAGETAVAAQLRSQPQTRTRPVVVVVPIVVTPAQAAATPEATAVGSSEGVTVTGSAGTASEPDSSSGQAYVVQTGDSLSALAQEYLGDQMRYPEIEAATNEKAKLDPSFTQITDPNLIEVGQKIWIPAS